jgi:hypothetical protein
MEALIVIKVAVFLLIHARAKMCSILAQIKVTLTTTMEFFLLIEVKEGDTFSVICSKSAQKRIGKSDMKESQFLFK